MTRQQKWAREALTRVQNMRNGPQEKSYRTECLRMPSLLRQSGAVQAIAFVRSRSDAARVFLFDLAAVCRGEAPDAIDALYGAALRSDLPQYLALSRDLVDVAVWFRRFALSELEGGEDEP
jgi:CRISPR-associated protein Cmr5